MTMLAQQWHVDKELLTALAVAAVVFGLLQCGWGYRIWRFMLALWGIADGFLLGAVVAQLVRPSEAAAVLGLQLLCAAVAGLLYAGIKPLGTFFVGATLGGASIQILNDAFGFANSMQQEGVVIVLLVAALFGGIVFAATGRAGIVVLSSLLGAIALVSGGFALANVSQGAGGAPLKTDELMLVLIGGVAVFAMFIQFGATARAPVASQSAGGASQATGARQQPVTTLQAHSAPQSDGSMEKRLTQLNELKSSGMISGAEYDRQKKRILAEL